MARTRPTVSLVIPAYNEERYLRACLDAIARQTVRPLEVIVVDNNSTDRTAAIARAYPFVRLIAEPRQGVGFARTAGFNAARGEIIGRLDADVLLPADWVERVSAFYAQPGTSLIVLSGHLHFYNFHFSRLLGRIHFWVVQGGNRLLLGHAFPCGSNSAIPRAVWRSVASHTCQRADVHEDLDLGVHLKHGGFSIWQMSLCNGAYIRRVTSQREELWEYLQMWPRTLRVHGSSAWRLVWLLVGVVWVGSVLIWGNEKLLGALGWRRYRRWRTAQRLLDV